MRNKEGSWNTLAGVLDRCWKMLSRGADRADDPFHWPVLGSAGKKQVSLRCVILREFSKQSRILVCHSDARAAKIREISVSGKVSWLFYHPRKKVQLRMAGHATLHSTDEFADRQWANLKATSRLNYATLDPPGSKIDSPTSGLPDILLRKIPSLRDTERFRHHFMAIACRFDSIDCVVLRALGNRRARFDWNENGLTATWLIP